MTAAVMFAWAATDEVATAPMTATARQLGYAWSRWRRKHQARARWHHYQARLRAAPT